VCVSLSTQGGWGDMARTYATADMWLAPLLGPHCVQADMLCGPPACVVTAVSLLLEKGV